MVGLRKRQHVALRTTCGFKDIMWLMSGHMSMYDLGQKFHLRPAEVTLIRLFPP